MSLSLSLALCLDPSMSLSVLSALQCLLHTSVGIDPCRPMFSMWYARLRSRQNQSIQSDLPEVDGTNSEALKIIRNWPTVVIFTLFFLLASAASVIRWWDWMRAFLLKERREVRTNTSASMFLGWIRGGMQLQHRCYGKSNGVKECPRPC